MFLINNLKGCLNNSIDELDIKIITKFNKLIKQEDSTSWKIMRALFPKGRGKEHNLIVGRMKKMEKMGLFIIEFNSPIRYSLISENVSFKKIKCPNNKIINSIWLNIYNKWRVMEI